MIQEMFLEALTWYSAVALAKKLGVSRQQIYNYKNGKSRPPAEVYLKLIDILLKDGRKK